MKRHQLSDLSVFVEVARSSGFRAAAEQLQLSPGSVSESVQRFEDRLGIRLLERTTRSIALTTAGRQLFKRSLPAMTELEQAIHELDLAQDEVAGTLKLSAPRSSGSLFLNLLIERYALRYPQVNVEIIYEDEKIDLVTSGVDAVIRSQTLLEQDTHAVPIGPELKTTVVASPDYLSRQGTPKTPDELLLHDGICFAFPGTAQLAPWHFEGKQGRYCVMPKPRMVVNDIDTVVRFAEQGLGLGYVYSYAVEPAISAKSLVGLFASITSPLGRYSLNYISKRHMPMRLRAFIDLAKSTNA